MSDYIDVLSDCPMLGTSVPKIGHLKIQKKIWTSRGKTIFSNKNGLPLLVQNF